MREFTVGSNEENQRFDKYLKKLLPGASTGFLYKMLRKKNITLDGKKATGNELLKKGQSVKVFFSEETFQKFMGDEDTLEAECRTLRELPMNGLRVIYEDEDLLVADKPGNMLSQKAKAEEFSANEYLLGYLLRSGSIRPEDLKTFRPSVCNRLDRNTTGLLLMGKSLKGLQDISSGLKNRSIHKFYRAIVAGTVSEPAHLFGWLIKDEKTNQVQILPKKEEGAVWVETAYEPVPVKNRKEDVTLLEIQLITGKTHQIRAHLASIGHPVIGDPKYGDRELNQKYNRQFHIRNQLLHACRLELPDGRVFTAPMPGVFQRVM